AESMVDVLAPALELAETAGFSRSARLLPVSQFTLRQITELYSGSYVAKSEVLRNAVDPDLFGPSQVSKDRPPSLLNVGRPHGIKGLEIFARAVAHLREKFADLTAEVVGYKLTGDSRSARLAESGIEFSGRVASREM